MTNTTLVLIYLAPVSLCYNYSFLYDFLFIHPNASISFVENRLFEFLVYPSINVSKKYLRWKLLEISQKNIYFGLLHSSTFASLLDVRKSTRLERSMSV